MTTAMTVEIAEITDVAMPAIYLRALAPEEIRDRYTAKALRPPTGPGIAGCWPLTHAASFAGHRRWSHPSYWAPFILIGDWQ